MWTFANGVPIYQQIVHTLKVRIANGTYPEGGRFPTVRELALDAGVNPNTMQRALSELEREGLLRSERTSGRFVTDDQAQISALRTELAQSLLEELYSQFKALGMTREEIIEVIRSYPQE